MAGSTPTPTLMALLCLGLCRGPGDQVQAGTFPKPSIWAEPGPMVPVGSPVTIWCQGSPQAEVYQLYRGFAPVWTEAPQSFSGKIGFSIESMRAYWAGRYQCGYHSLGASSELSDPLALDVTGVFPAPSLSAQPSPVVASGGRVTLSCRSRNKAETFHLLKEGGADQPRHQFLSFPQGTQQALFPVGPVSPSHAGAYRCYHNSISYPHQWSEPSAPLRLQVTGVYTEPSLSARPGPLVPSGHNLTLCCASEAGFNTFALTKDKGLMGPPRLEGQHSPDFPLGPANSNHGGQYRCYGGHSLSQAWSAPSAPLDILITGLDRPPALSAQPGTSVTQGENVILRCRSDGRVDTFLLSKEGSPAPPQRLRVQDPAAPPQADFTFSNVTFAQGGTYRCYSSRSTTPHLLSAPSEPLELRVSGTQSLNWGYLRILIGVSVPFVLLLSFLLLFLLLLRQRRLGGHRSSEAAALKHRGLQHSSRLAAGVQEENLYASVGDAQPEDRQPAHQVAPEGSREVTYAQLDHWALQPERAPPSSPSETPLEPSEYASLAAHASPVDTARRWTQPPDPLGLPEDACRTLVTRGSLQGGVGQQSPLAVMTWQEQGAGSSYN